MLLEQGSLSGGTTWHAAGLVGQMRSTENGTRLVQYSADLYSRLEAETGLATGYKRCGGVTVARTPERMVQLRRTAATAEAFDLECELITPGPGPGALPDPGDRGPARRDLAARATAPPTRPTSPRRWPAGPGSAGARIFEHTRVTGIYDRRRRGHRACGPTAATSRPRSSSTAPASGPRRSARMCGVTVPLHSAEHFYVVTDQIDGRAPRPADPARPGRLHLLQGGGRRPGRRRVRAARPSRGSRRTSCPTRSSSSCWRRTGTTSRS